MCIFRYFVLFAFAGTCLASGPGLPGDAPDRPHGPPHGLPCFKKAGGPRSNPWNKGWIADAVTSERFIESAGLTAEQVASLKAKTREIAELNQSLETNLLAVTREQARVYRDILQDKKLDPAPLYAFAEKIAALRAEQAKLSIRLILCIRETLNEEQFKQMDAFLREEGRKRHLERMNFRRSRDLREKDGFAPPRKPGNEGA